MQGTVQRKTKHLVLRRYTMDDVDILYKTFGKNEAMYRYSGWNPFQTWTMTRKSIQKYIACYNDPTFYGWAIEKEGELIGTIGAYDFDAKERTIEVGMSIAEHCWGHGYATEALSVVIEYLMNEENMHAIQAWCAADNIGSKTVMEKCGMKLQSVDAQAIVVGSQIYDRLNYVYRNQKKEGE